MKTKKIFAALLFGTLMLFTSCDDNDINTTVIPVQTIRQGNIDLAGASTLAVLAGSTITNTGATSVTGDIGLSPGSSIGGFPPWLYKSNSSLEISSGDLTFDAKENPHAVFIVQVASSFTMTSGRQVFLKVGAKAENIFWQIGSSATLGTTSVMKGTIMAMQSITLNTSASVEGRVLARTGAVVMAANTIVKK